MGTRCAIERWAHCARKMEWAIGPRTFATFDERAWQLVPSVSQADNLLGKRTVVTIWCPPQITVVFYEPVHAVFLPLWQEAIDAGIFRMRSALALQPDLLPAQRALVDMALKAGRSTEALGIARQVQTQRPNGVGVPSFSDGGDRL